MDKQRIQMESIVLYPTPAIGHLIAMVELGKLIISSNPSLSIHILITKPPYNDGDSFSYITAVSEAVPSIKFHHLPPVPLPQDIANSSLHHEALTFEVLRHNKSLVSEALSGIISASLTVHAFVVDFFCGNTLEVAANLGVPSYVFYPSAAFTLSAFLYLPTLHREMTKSFKDLARDEVLSFPGVPPIPAPDMPKPWSDRHDPTYKSFLQSAACMPRAVGVIVNTFEALEPRALNAIRDGLCIPDGLTPEIYCIGPLIHHNNSGDSKPRHDCLKWLDLQPKRSVVFLCFGSLGLFSAEQIKEIAVGLENSGERFLWVVRNPPPDKKSLNLGVLAGNLVDPDLEDILPEGFVERTKERGLAVKKWAPQVEVLSHASVGGFVSHCGWNSVLESVSSGVPMVAWPLYAEQRFNRVVLVDEIKIAIPMNDDPNGFVGATEIQRRVTELMASCSKGSDSVRERALKMRDEAKAALSIGGSSRLALTELIESWKCTT